MKIAETSQPLVMGQPYNRFRRLPFGLSCLPAIFTRHMAALLSPLLKEGWIKNYLDDLIIGPLIFLHLLKDREKASLYLRKMVLN